MRKGFAVHISKRRLTSARLFAAIDGLLSDPAVRARATEFQALSRAWNGPENAARFLEEAFGARS